MNRHENSIHAPWPWKTFMVFSEIHKPPFNFQWGVTYVTDSKKIFFFIWTFLKHCKAFSTEKYRLYINIFIISLFIYLWRSTKWTVHRKAVTTSALRSVPKRLKPHISLHQESLTRNHTLWLRGVEHVEEWCASMPMSTTGLLRPASPLGDCVRTSGSEEVSASPLSWRSTMQ